MKKRDRKEIESMVYLLEDPDDFIRKSVKEELLKLNENSVPILDELRSKTRDKNQRKELREIIHTITFQSFQHEFLNLLDNGIYDIKDLEEAVFLLSRFDDPTMRTARYKEILDDMALEITPEIRNASSMISKMKLLTGYVYNTKGFEGCKDDYINPKHSYLNQVIDSRKGIPLSLAMIILFLARRLHLPFYGVNMPLHFLLKFEYVDEPVLIDPFNNGAVLSKEQCALFLKKSGVKPLNTHFSNAREIDMLARFMRNLINGYQKQRDTMRTDDMTKLLSLLEASRL